MQLLKNAVIGYTGFIGSHIQDHLECPFDRYNSKNIHEIHGKEYDIVYLAGLPATKWMINKDPETDIKNMQSLQFHLLQANISRVILISTIDVYDSKKQLQDEQITKVSEDSYGKHRYIMEEWIRLNYSTQNKKYHIIRLPALFGVGLKKNIIYDLIHNNAIVNINPYTFYQWYNVSDLMSDIKYAVIHDIDTLNLFSEPIWTLELVKECFPEHNISNNNCPSTTVYNYKTRYSPSMNGYAYNSKAVIFNAVKNYLKIQKSIMNSDRLLVSNLAWSNIWEDNALDILKKYGMSNIELAITKYIDWKDLNIKNLEELKAKFNKYNINIYSLQAIFFGIDSNVFTDSRGFISHFKYVLKTASYLGAKKIVFGSPKNRLKPENMTLDEADTIFIEAMTEIVETAKEYNITVCLEPNAIDYGCNYITTIKEAIYIIQEVNSEYFKLNLDLGNAKMMKDLLDESIVEYVGHIQISEPYLAEIKNSIQDSYYKDFIKIFSREILVKNNLYISLEMKPLNNYTDFLPNIKKFVSMYGLE